VALAAALPTLEHACGLGTVGLFERDVATAPLRPTGGLLSPARPVPDATALTELAAAADRQDWWRERLVRCHAVLECTGEVA